MLKRCNIFVDCSNLLFGRNSYFNSPESIG